MKNKLTYDNLIRLYTEKKLPIMIIKYDMSVEGSVEDGRGYNDKRRNDKCSYRAVCKFAAN